VSGYEIVTADSTTSSYFPRAAEANCPPGKTLIGGGGKAFSSANGGEWNVPSVALTQSAPEQLPYQAWLVYANEMNPIDTDWTVRAYAICAAVQQAA
jgi:hypothetical protein